MATVSITEMRKLRPKEAESGILENGFVRLSPSHTHSRDQKRAKDSFRLHPFMEHLGD